MASLRSSLLLLAISIDRALSQTCDPAGNAGACLLLIPGDKNSGICPPGYLCLINLPDPVCCEENSVVTTTEAPSTTTTEAPASTTTPAADCVDLLNPVTGISDCSPKRALCQDPAYHDVMSVRCAATCGFCTSARAPTCFDQFNPASCSTIRTDCRGCRRETHTACSSDCASMANYCEMPAYRALVGAQCPATCGRCGTTTTTTTTTKSRPPEAEGSTGEATGECTDLLNPATGHSDCHLKAALCREIGYSVVMAVQCARTCGMCNSTLNDLTLRAIRSKFYTPFQD